MQNLLTTAVAQHQAGHIQQAKTAYQTVLEQDPNHFDALQLLALAEQQSGNAAIALPYFARALAINPNHAPTHSNLGNALRELGRHHEALQSYERALQLQPNYPTALNNRGNVLNDLDRPQEALASIEAALALQPDWPQAHSNRGNALRKLNRSQEALACFERALALKPDWPEVLSNKSCALQDLQQPSLALQACEQALTLKPDSIEALVNCGNALQNLNRPHEALAHYERALQLAPNNPDAHWNKGFCQLQLGELPAAWQQYEWRWKSKKLEHLHDHFNCPLWLGQESLEGKTIVIHAEQGLGDTLQFCRFVPLVAQLGAKVIFEVPPALHSLLLGWGSLHVNIARLTPGDSLIPPHPSPPPLGEGMSVIAQGTTLPSLDFHCPLLSLPFIFQTSLDNIPAASGYITAPDQHLAKWLKRLGPKTKPRIGLVWSGTMDIMANRKRSMRLAQLQPLWSRPEFEFFSLQKDVPEQDLPLPPHITHLGPQLHDFADTAAALAHLDLLISIDTSVAHLAGGLGKPVWVMLPFASDWRWLLNRTDSPWYQSARLFRQPELGNWSAVAAQLSEALNNKSDY